MKVSKEFERIMEINIDFDGTCVTHDFPHIGKDIGAVPVLKKLTDNGHRLILFTMRSKRDGSLQEAIKWFESNDIPLYGIQENPTQKQWTDSPKSYAQLTIDDSALGCPIMFDGRLSDRPFVNWDKVEKILSQDYRLF